MSGLYLRLSRSLSGLFSGELPECTQDLMIDVTKSYYQKFMPLSQIWVALLNSQPGPLPLFSQPHVGGSHQTLKSSPFICHRPEALSLISQEKNHHVLKSDSVAQSYHVLASPNFWEIKWNPVRCHSDALPCPLHHGEKLVDPLCGLWSLPSLPDGSLRAAADEDEEVEELRRMQEHGF